MTDPTSPDLPAALEDAWSDFRRSLARRGRKPGTVEVYRKSFLNFWRWAVADGLPPDPGAVDHRVLNWKADPPAASRTVAYAKEWLNDALAPVWSAMTDARS